MLTIKQHWELFAEQVIHKDASQSQIKAMRAAFYGGALVASTIHYEIGNSNVSEEQGVAMIERIHEELRIFEQEMAEGINKRNSTNIN